MYAYLTILTGKHAGANFPLDRTRETLIGRGTDCHITLADPLCSRVHSIVKFEDGHWTVRDHQSLNHTFLNGTDLGTNVARVSNEGRIKLGSTEFEFRLSSEPPTSQTDDATLTQTIVQDVPIAVRQSTEEVLAVLPTAEQVFSELVLLYQLSIRLAGCEKPEEVINCSLELLKERTKAAVVGFLWVDDEDKLRPKYVIPQEALDRVTLSKNLTELVLSQGHAVWVANQTTDGVGPKPGIEHFADAVCAPLVRKDRDNERRTIGAFHVYMEDGRFRQSDFDFIIAVANLVTIALVRARAHTSLETDFKRLVRASPGFDELIGQSKPMLSLKAKIDRVARAPGCVLVRGESGSGKELVARAIHRASNRSDRPMLSVNCAAIPAELMESQLFGHKQGAFTGADRDHAGYFQQADLGTLFLDEIGELTLEGQAKLLRVLEGHPFLPVGATKQVKVDVRLIAATNQDLQNYVREKKFREDLYFRLSVFELYIPPLRDRETDIGLLIDYFLDHFRRERGRPYLKLSTAAREKLLAYRWPGNVRQLRNVMDSAVVLADDEILPHDLGLRDCGASEQLDSLDLEVWERKLIREALERTAGSVPDAAKLLGIGRATLYRKIEQYGIER